MGIQANSKDFRAVEIRLARKYGELPFYEELLLSSRSKLRR